MGENQYDTGRTRNEYLSNIWGRTVSLSITVIEKSPRGNNGRKGLQQNLKFLHIGGGVEKGENR